MKRARVYVVEQCERGVWHRFGIHFAAADAKASCRYWAGYTCDTYRVMAYDRADRKPMLVCKGSKSDE